ncbi:MAG: stage II sporulation protein M [Anaerolineales bacterium]|nr:stage II sporulation protein M [Anaerolineales bacterium]
MDNLKPAFVIAKREIRDQFRDWRVIFPILFLTLIFPFLMNFTADRVINFAASYDASLVGEKLVPFLMMIVGFFPSSVSLVIALESFVGEKERGSIEPLLTSPLTDFQLYFGKLIAVMVPPMVGSYLGILVYLAFVFINLDWKPDPQLLILTVVLTFVQMLVMVNGAVVISTQTTSVKAANLLSSFIVIPVALLIQGESILLFWGDYGLLWGAVIGLVIISGLLIRTGLGHFNREELLGKELDTINVKGKWWVFKKELIGKADTLGTWYYREVFPAVGRLWFPMIVIAVGIVIAYILGAQQTSNLQLPEDFVIISSDGKAYFPDLERINSVDLFSAKGILFIFWHNLRVYLLAAVLGMFTFGVLGVLITMLPFALIGFILGLLVNSGYYSHEILLKALVLPHAIFEIPAIILIGASIFSMGAKLASDNKTEPIGEGLVRSWANWVKVTVGLGIPLMLAAAVVEALVTPQIAIALLAP